MIDTQNAPCDIIDYQSKVTFDRLLSYYHFLFSFLVLVVN